MTKKKLNNRRKKKLSRECWCLDYTFYEWLLEHLQVYLKDASKYIDLEFNKEEYNGKEYTQEEAINRMIELCKLLTRDDSSFLYETEYSDELIDLWKIWHRAMWW